MIKLAAERGRIGVVAIGTVRGYDTVLFVTGAESQDAPGTPELAPETLAMF